MVKILIIDDEAAMVEGITKTLSQDGYQIDGTTNGEDGIALIRQGYDIIITDLVMPGMSGMDILREVKNNSASSAVIMITGFATVEGAVDAMKQGARDYITKPFEVEALRKVVKDVEAELAFEKKTKDVPRDYAIKPQDVDKVIKALSNPIRRGTAEFLKGKKASFTEIWKTLEVDDPTKLSFHLRVLKQAHLIDQDPHKIYFLTESGTRAIDLIENL